MRLALIGLATVIAALAADMRTGNAEYNSRWCTDGAGRGGSGTLECAYKTLEQCRARASGLGMHCVENPDIAWRARGWGSPDPNPPRKARR